MTSFLIIAVCVFVWFNLQHISDWVQYQLYEPPERISNITLDTGMTDSGKFAFYSAQPEVESGEGFNAHCDRKEKKTAILGCYTGGNIYIYNVTDNRLKGIKEVTATHEMLHAVYTRLSDSEKNRINVLIESEYQKMKSSKEFSERMKFYARTEPGERNNELHSIIGTEVEFISPELEQYYAKYFNRKAVLALYKGYRGEFTKLADSAKQLKEKIQSLRKSVDSEKAKYAADVKQLTRDIKEFNDRANNGAFSSQSEFDSERQELVARATKLQNRSESINNLVDTYNSLIKQLNEIITQSNDLYESIDSSVVPVPKV